MKKVILIFALAIGIVSMYSCKKCSTCTYGSGAGAYTYPEACGKKKDIEAYESACKTAATAVGQTCSCTSK